MIRRVEHFAQLLRTNGVRVSTVEVMDAARALRAVGLSSQSVVRAALATSLIKSDGDRNTFDALYDLYFLRRRSALEDGGESVLLGDVGIGAELHALMVERLLEQSAGAAVAIALGLVPMSRGNFDVGALIAAAAQRAGIAAMRSPLQTGFFSYQIGLELSADYATSQVAELMQWLVKSGHFSPEQAAAVEELAKLRLENLRRDVRAFVSTEFAQRSLDFTEQLAVSALAKRSLTTLTDDDVDLLRKEVARLARRLRARQRHRLRPSGRLDPRRTLRRALATGGVPFELTYRARRAHKPSLVVLCDVSDSVRTVSRFMLQLVYTLHELFSRVSSFGFVADLGELTGLFRRYDLSRALNLTYAGAAVNLLANSDYGNALQQFADRHMSLVTSRTTVLIIGDGRTNYHDPRVELLHGIQRRAKQVWWLNPESPASWGFGDSAMRDYREQCDRVVVARDLKSLEGVIDELVM